MRIAINTSSLAVDSRKGLERAADLGFGTVEINLSNEEFAYDYRRKPAAGFYRRLRAEVDRLGLEVWSVSAPVLSQEQMFSERTRQEIIIGGAGAAGILGARVFVVQPADIFSSQTSFDRYMSDGAAPAVTKGFDEFWVQVVNRKMTMALLNRDYWIGTLLTNNADRLAAITTDLAIGCALDIRQALTRNELSVWIDILQERLAAAYAYDVLEDGTVTTPVDEQWAGWLPMLGDSRLKVLTIKANSQQTDAEIEGSRRLLENWLA